jgi:predicted O-methyltransferase YrrM
MAQIPGLLLSYSGRSMMFSNLHDFTNRPLETCYNADGPIVPEQYAWELEQLINIYIEKRPLSIVEIGVREGGTLYHWLKNIDPKAQIVAIDNIISVEQRTLWNSWDVNNQLTIINSNSADCVDQVKQIFPDGIDWLFIDGDHSYEGALSDVMLYGPLVHGVMALHDILYDRSGVPKLWYEIRRASYITQEFIANREDEHGAGIGVVYL